MTGFTIFDMKSPARPGEIIREEYMAPLGLTVTDAAKGLGVSRESLSELLNGRRGVSIEMAQRLEKAGWSAASAWLTMQLAYDLWRSRDAATALEVPAPWRNAAA